MLTERELVEKIIRQKKKDKSKLENVKQIIKARQESTRKIKPVSGFSAGWAMGAYGAYETCLKVLSEECDETNNKR